MIAGVIVAADGVGLPQLERDPADRPPAKVDDDDTAKAGYIPVFGPIMWAFSKDEDDVGEDGWDWLAVGGSLVQGMGVWLIITDGESAKSNNKVNVSAITTKSYSGLVVGGRF